MTVYGYARIAKSENNLGWQTQTLRQHGVKPKNLYAERFTGTTFDRPSFKDLLSRVKSGDTIMMTSLDRLSRSLQQMLIMVGKLHKAGITIDVLDMGKIDFTSHGKAMAEAFAAIRKYEHNIIISRVSCGKKRARNSSKPFKEGRPQKYSKEQILEAYRLRQEEGWSYKRLSSELHISESTLYTEFRKIRHGEQLDRK